LEHENKYIRSLVESAQSGNNAALEQLFEMNLRRIYALSHRLMGNMRDAEKLSSAVFVKAWENLHLIDENLTFSKWLIDLNIKTALVKLKEQPRTVEKKKKKLFGKKAEQEKAQDDKLLPFDKTICSLPENNRIAFVLNNVENYSADEIAGLLPSNADEVKNYINKAEESLLQDENIKTQEMLDKRISELPKEIKAETGILTDALNEIYEVKMKEKEIEEELKKEEEEEEVEVKEQKPVAGKEKTIKIKVDTDKRIRSREEIAALKRKISFGLTALVFLVLIIIWIVSSSGNWKVIRSEGLVKINSDVITGTGKLASGDLMEVAVASTAEVNIPAIGTINAFEYTNLSRGDKNNSAKLIKGRIDCNFTNSKEYFNLQVSGITISDLYLGNRYSVTLDKSGSGKITVDLGWLVLKDGKNEVLVPRNYSANILNGAGDGLPYHKSSSPELIDAINKFSFNSGDELSINKIISLASTQDAVTLWNLFKQVPYPVRLTIFQKLNEQAPLPSNINQEDLLNLKEEPMKAWLEEIEASI